MIEQKRQIRTRLEIVKADGNRLIDQAKSARSGMKFSNKAEIEKEIARLQRKQETQSMSLRLVALSETGVPNEMSSHLFYPTYYMAIL